MNELMVNDRLMLGFRFSRRSPLSAFILPFIGLKVPCCCCLFIIFVFLSSAGPAENVRCYIVLSAHFGDLEGRPPLSSCPFLTPVYARRFYGSHWPDWDSALCTTWPWILKGNSQESLYSFFLICIFVFCFGHFGVFCSQCFKNQPPKYIIRL